MKKDELSGLSELWQSAPEKPVIALDKLASTCADPVIEAGADFIAVSSGVWNHPQGPASAVKTLYQLCLAHSSS